jgi:hypothetical protein
MYRLLIVATTFLFLGTPCFSQVGVYTLSIRHLSFQDTGISEELRSVSGELPDELLKRIETAPEMKQMWSITRHIRLGTRLEDFTQIEDCSLELKLGPLEKQGKRVAFDISFTLECWSPKRGGADKLQTNIEVVPNKPFALGASGGGKRRAGVLILELKAGES